MEPLHNPEKPWAKAFILAAAGLLILGMVFGLTGGLQYLIPGFLKQSLSFEKVRPLHVSSVVFWILLAAMGAVLTYIQEHSGEKLRFPQLVKYQWILFAVTITGILVSYVFGVFGGREYWEFHPVFSIPFFTGWVLFAINVIGSLKTLKKQPVYVWMWCTGAVFFLFTFLESYLWIFPYFRNHLVRDMTVQWKSYGSMVGAWNMLIYGSSIYLMDKIAGNKKYSHSSIGFGLYFLGLFNLMFNWGHHIYTLPAPDYIKYIAYGVSMTELLLLGRIIYLWKQSVSTARKHLHLLSYRFLLAADIWIFLTLGLAIAMSVPALNVYMHGTHVVVGHTMGATIGINSMLLLAFCFDILGNTCQPVEAGRKWVLRGYLLANCSLFVFWGALLTAGFVKARWQMGTPQVPFGSMMKQLVPYFQVFVISGLFLFGSFLLILAPLLKNALKCYFAGEKSINSLPSKKPQPQQSVAARA